MIPGPILTCHENSSMTLLKTKVKKFEAYHSVDKKIDEQINEFVEANNVSILDVKYVARERDEIALVIYMEQVEVK